MNPCAEFGKYLKQLRLNKGFGVREFARRVDILPSNYHHIETGLKKPPQDPEKITRIILELGILEDEKTKAEFYDLHAKAIDSVPLDVAEVIKESDAIPMLLRTVDNRKLSEKEVRKLIEYVRHVKV
jgi:transcriptional regulator with XRE-family HTH domain